MLDKIGKEFDFQQRALNLRAYRQEVIASNIANADTPNYKAVDFDFKQALQSARLPCSIAMRFSKAWTVTPWTWTWSVPHLPITRCSTSPR